MEPSLHAWGLEVVGLQLDRRAGGLAAQLHAQLKARLLAGEAGSRLPPTRQLAQQLGVSRNTVLHAYERLAEEGFLSGRAGAGSAVRQPLPVVPALAQPLRLPTPLAAERWPELPEPFVAPSPQRPFRLGLPPLDLFPFEVWARLQRRFWRQAERGGVALGYTEPAGLPRLRELLALWLCHSRGLHCSAEQVLVTSGAQQAFSLIALALLNPGDRVALEMPGYHALAAALRLARAQVIGVPVDAEGLRPAALAALGPCKMVALTPSHQWPTGVSLSLPRRLELLDWARRQQAWVLEDDYAGEYRFDGTPLPALASLDAQGRCLFVGSFSKLLLPGLRLGYLVLPPGLMPLMRRLRLALDRQPPLADQSVLADFIEQGLLNGHLRRMRRVAAARRAALLAAWSAEFGARWPLQAPPSGLSVFLPLADGAEEQRLVARARAAELDCAGVHELLQSSRLPFGPAGLVLGFGAVPEGRMADAVRRLGAVWR